MRYNTPGVNIENTQRYSLHIEVGDKEGRVHTGHHFDSSKVDEPSEGRINMAAGLRVE